MVTRRVSVVLLATAIGVLVALPTIRSWRFRKTVRVLEERGFVSRSPFSEHWSVDLAGSGVDDHAILAIADLGDLESVNLRRNPEVTDFGATEMINNCHRIDQLYLEDTSATGSFLAQVRAGRCPRVVRIGRRNERLPLPYLGKCDGLEELLLEGYGIDRSAVVGLSKLPKLKKLEIWYCNVDASAPSILQSKGIELHACAVK